MEKLEFSKALSIDLACKSIKDFGICLLEVASRDGPIGVHFLSAEEVGLTDPPTPKECAEAITAFCRAHQISIALLDGPQGWKDPESALPHCRLCEKLLNAPAKTGVVGHVKPRTYSRFVSFSILLFEMLQAQGAVLVSEINVAPKHNCLLVGESLPLAAWKALGLDPLPAKKKATIIDIEKRLSWLKSDNQLDLTQTPNHDQLQALVSGLAAVSILKGDTNGYSVAGKPPTKTNGVLLEGFIINPRNEILKPSELEQLRLLT